jgi:hypothetical protein
MIDSARTSPFEADGVYDGIPYRVLADCSIEAMLHGSLVKFKNMDQFIASTSRAAATGSSQSTKPYDQLGNANERSAKLPASAQPLDYYSILLETIKNTQQNSAQLRALVYERARFNFKRDILFGHSSLGLTDLVRHVNDFELAVARIEANAIDGQRSLAHHHENDHEHVVGDAELAFTRGDGVAYREEANPLEATNPSSNAVQIMPPMPTAPLYAEAGSFQRIEDFPYHQRSEEFWRYQRFANQIIGILGTLGIVVIGIVIVMGVLWHWSTVSPGTKTASLPKTDETGSTKSTPKEDVAPKVPQLPYPVPTSYGIYALNDNKLVELKPLPISVPDPRIALSAEIKKQTTATISNDRPAFILFRRDLLNNAPQMMTLRVIARMARETKIINGTASVTKIEGSWRIRNIARELKVSPVPGQPEMIIARLDDNSPLAAGRYALVLNRVGFDFTIAGTIKSLAFCLEGFQTATNGTMFNQCRTP